MNNREQFFKLIEAQDNLRRVWAFRDHGIVRNWLKEIDLQLTKVINAVGATLEGYDGTGKTK